MTTKTTTAYELDDELVKMVVEVLGEANESTPKTLERALRMGAGQHEMRLVEKALNQKAQAALQAELSAKQIELGNKWGV